MHTFGLCRHDTTMQLVPFKEARSRSNISLAQSQKRRIEAPTRAPVYILFRRLCRRRRRRRRCALTHTKSLPSFPPPPFPLCSSSSSSCSLCKMLGPRPRTAAWTKDEAADSTCGSVRPSALSHSLALSLRFLRPPSERERPENDGRGSDLRTEVMGKSAD